MRGERVGGAVTWGLLGAWVVHDLEELVTVPGWLRRHVPELRKRFPQVPERVWRRAGTMDAAELAAAVGVMGVFVGAASAAGRLTLARRGAPAARHGAPGVMRGRVGSMRLTS
ncbi:HXXEE domain-containing protein [Streptomyces pseudogriseolus]|uniref:HXXEE domain-containing protein n=1 Tax=Streptomyces pseudogriseolus TaxID=36817 RepID=UPI003490A375